MVNIMSLIKHVVFDENGNILVCKFDEFAGIFNGPFKTGQRK